MKLSPFTFYDLCGEDHGLSAQINNKMQIRVHIENEAGKTVYEEDSHPYAWDTLVDFAKQVIRQDTKIQDQLKKLDCTW